MWLSVVFGTSRFEPANGKVFSCPLEAITALLVLVILEQARVGWPLSRSRAGRADNNQKLTPTPSRGVIGAVRRTPDSPEVLVTRTDTRANANRWGAGYPVTPAAITG